MGAPPRRHPRATGWPAGGQPRRRLVDAHGDRPPRISPPDFSRALADQKAAATPMTAWGERVAPRYIRFIYSSEPVWGPSSSGLRRHEQLSAGTCARQSRHRGRGRPPLLQVVADYTRLSAVQTAGHAGHRRASGPQCPGVAADRCRAGAPRPADPVLDLPATRGPSWRRLRVRGRRTARRRRRRRPGSWSRR